MYLCCMYSSGGYGSGGGEDCGAVGGELVISEAEQLAHPPHKRARHNNVRTHTSSVV